jgi:hypothetical protein
MLETDFGLHPGLRLSTQRRPEGRRATIDPSSCVSVPSRLRVKLRNLRSLDQP